MVVVVTMIPHLSEGPLIETYVQVLEEQALIFNSGGVKIVSNCEKEEESGDDDGGDGGKILTATNCSPSPRISPVGRAAGRDPCPGVKRISARRRRWCLVMVVRVVVVINTFLKKSVQLSYLPCMKQFGLTVSVSCPVYTDGNRGSPLGVSVKGMYISCRITLA